MKLFLSLTAAIAFAAASVNAGSVKTYQVTGPVLEVTPTVIAIQKGDERWEIARTDATKVTGELKVGEKVTIHYSMTAVSVETK